MQYKINFAYKEEGQNAWPGNDAQIVTENRDHMDKFGKVDMIRQGSEKKVSSRSLPHILSARAMEAS